LEGARPVRLVGPLRDELSRLAGARVEVWGELTTSPDPMVDRQLAAGGYEVVSVNDRPVLFGELVEVGAGTARLRTTDGREVHLTGVPSNFRVGQKVWVQGPESVIVQTYGTVRP
jgi:hypothetical protein